MTQEEEQPATQKWTATAIEGSELTGKLQVPHNLQRHKSKSKHNYQVNCEKRHSYLHSPT